MVFRLRFHGRFHQGSRFGGHAIAASDLQARRTDLAWPVVTSRLFVQFPGDAEARGAVWLDEEAFGLQFRRCPSTVLLKEVPAVRAAIEGWLRGGQR